MRGESASDIADADQSVCAQPQLGGDAISDGLDVLVVQHHGLARPPNREELRSD
jgi:hypothetical protein